jgi:hypothetical protein
MSHWTPRRNASLPIIDAVTVSFYGQLLYVCAGARFFIFLLSFPSSFSFGNLPVRGCVLVPGRVLLFPSVLIDRHATRIPFSPPKHLTMFQSPFTSSSSCNFRSIFVAALKDYERKTKTDLHLHPLATQLHSCKSSSDILAVLHDKVNELDQSKSCSERLSSWLNPTVKVLYAFSTALGEEVGLVSLNWSAGPLSPLNCFLQILSPTQIISVGIGVLLLVGIFLSPFLEGF